MKLHQSKLTGWQRDKGKREERRVGQHEQPRVGKLLDLGVGYFNQLHRQSSVHTHTHTHRQTITHSTEQNRAEQNRQFKALDTVAERPAGLDVLEKLIKWSDLHYSQVLISITKLKWAKAHEQHTGWTGTDTQTRTRTHSHSVRASPGEFQPSCCIDKHTNVRNLAKM